MKKAAKWLSRLVIARTPDSARLTANERKRPGPDWGFSRPGAKRKVDALFILIYVYEFGVSVTQVNVYVSRLLFIGIIQY
jgi:hypothetical protein